MAQVLEIDQDYEIVVQYGQAFRNKFIFQDFNSNFPQHQLIKCNNHRANRSDIDAVIDSDETDIRFISGMGHGLYYAFTGQNGDVIWDAATDDFGYLNDMILHFLSCQTGAILGREMVKDGVAAFWGYSVNFVFYHQNTPPNQLDKDSTAEVYFRMDAIIDRGILRGKGAQEIYDSVQRYVAQVYPQLNNAQRAVLLDNFVHLVCPATVWGDPKATI